MNDTITITSKEYADLNKVSVRYVNQSLSDGKMLSYMVDFRKAGGTWLIQVLELDFFRVANHKTMQGLWYDQEGNFTGLIHDKFDFCFNSGLKMPFDESLTGWLSAANSIENLLQWFPVDDLKKLENFGYYIYHYRSAFYRFYNNHYVIDQKLSKINGRISIPNLELIK